MSNARPLSISLVVWLAIIAGVSNLLNNASGEQIGTQLLGPIVMSIASICDGVEVLSGIWMLRGSRDARIVYTACLAGRTALVGWKMFSIGMPSLVFFVVASNATILYFLYRPIASQFFASSRIRQ